MPSKQIYDKLRSLTLFQGLDISDINEVIGYTKFSFAKVETGDNIIHEGDHCNQLTIILNGKISITSHAANRSYNITETISAPIALQPEHLFGLFQQYTKTVVAAAPCQIMMLHKSEVVRLMQEYDIIRMNITNHIATKAQKADLPLWRQAPESLRERIIAFVARRCLRPAGSKTIHIRMADLAREVCDSRRDVSQELNLMQDQGLISLSRETIHIHALEKLFT